MSAQKTYLALLGEAVERLNAALAFHVEFGRTRHLPTLDAAVLQVRKALEVIAIAAIAPDKNAYAAFRATANKERDFTKDFHAAKIFAALKRVNPDFYPKALLPATRQPDGSWHFDDKKVGTLTQKQFERSYDRLGKHLHAHNPWGSQKHTQNLATDLPALISGAKGLIALHARFIRSPAFNGVWIVEADSPQPKITVATAAGAYVVRAD